MKQSAEAHRVYRRTFAPRELAAFKAVDFAEAPLGSVRYEAIATAQEDPLYKWALKEQVRREGIRVPAIVFQRKATGPFRLVDGHHRAVLSLDLQLALTSEVHECFCPPSVLDNFALCPAIWERVRLVKRENP